MSAKMNVPELRFKEFSGEWEEKKLGEIAKVTMGQSPDSISYNEDGNGLPLIQGNADCKNRKTLPRIFTSQKTKECFIDDIIMTVRAPVGAVSKSFHNACIGRGVCAIKAKESNDFLYQFLVNYEDKWAKYSQGSTFTAVNSNDIKTLKINLPSKPEQQKIASFLSSVDTKIEQFTKKKTLLEQYKKGVMQKIFSQEIRFRDDDGGEYPEWVERKLGEVAIVTMGSSPNSSAYNTENNGLPLLQGNADISNRKSNPRIYTSEITKECLIGDILLSVRAPVGEVAKAYHHACIGRGISSIRAHDEFVQEYIYQLLLWFEPKWKRYSQGSTFEAVNSKDIKELTLPFPSKLEQTKIANLLSSIDIKISQTGQQLEATKQFKKALLQKMFV